VVGAARDASHRWQGVRAEARRRHFRDAPPDDLRLIERVRAKLGRLVRHPHAVQVGANRGVVVLSGPILAAEVGELLEAVRAVPGVTAIEDHLAVYESGSGVSSLQDGDIRH
jgi:osmotically-inducible protein OsmY